MKHLLLFLPLLSLASTFTLHHIDGTTFSLSRAGPVKPWPFGPVPLCSVSITPDHDNFIASRLPGKWSFHQPITAFLKLDTEPTKDPMEQEVEDIIISFTEEPEVLSQLTEDKCVFLQQTDRDVFTAGTFGIHSEKHGNHLFPYVLINHHGISAIVYWPNDGPTAIPMLVQMAPAIQTQHDLLLLGEDVIGKPFGLLHRVGVQVPGEPVAPILKVQDLEDTETEPEAEAEAETETETETETKTVTDTELEIETEMETEMEAETEVEDVAESRVIVEDPTTVMPTVMMEDPVVKLLVDGSVEDMVEATTVMVEVVDELVKTAEDGSVEDMVEATTVMVEVAEDPAVKLLVDGSVEDIVEETTVMVEVAEDPVVKVLVDESVEEMVEETTVMVDVAEDPVVKLLVDGSVEDIVEETTVMVEVADDLVKAAAEGEEEEEEGETAEVTMEDMEEEDGIVKIITEETVEVTTVKEEEVIPVDDLVKVVVDTETIDESEEATTVQTEEEAGTR